jgi:pimeloyl-ACP methyl ester carboxylesterase/DNA-binding CsgD family transcriptional regulator
MNQEIRFCVTSDNVRLAYARAGQGSPLVKVGTWLTHLEHDWNSPVWRPWLDGLCRHHTLYRYDPRGCGLSDWNVDTLSIDALVSDLETVVDAAGLNQFALMGMSQGGSIAILYAARHPERVSHLVIYGGYMQGRGRKNLSAIEVEEREVFGRLLRLAWAVNNPAYKQVLSTELLPEGTAEQIGWLNDLQRVSTSADNAVKLAAVYSQMDVAELATTVRTPTLVLHAKQDVAVKFEDGRLIATHIRDARFVPLDSQNHILLPSEPAWSQFWREFYGFFGISQLQAEDVLPDDMVSDPHTSLAQLTLREREILHLLAQGYRNEEIARSLVLTPKTVRNYVSRIYEKLHVSSRGEAIVLARKAGFGSRQ